MRILNVMPINYKGVSSNKNNGVSQNYRNSVYNAPCMAKVNFGNAVSSLPINFDTVIENKLFRGGLPKTVGHFKALKEKGVTFIMDLCGENGREAEMAKEAGIEYIYKDGDKLRLNFNMEEISKTLQLVKDKIDSGGVGYIHCKYGEVRTGFLVAYYQAKILNMPIADIEKHYTKYDYGFNSLRRRLSC